MTILTSADEQKKRIKGLEKLVSEYEKQVSDLKKQIQNQNLHSESRPKQKINAARLRFHEGKRRLY